MRFEELNWMDVESYLQHDDRLILILGACEQHGYLSLLTDVKIPQAMADAASQRSGVIIAPVITTGVVPYHLAYPGTLSLRLTTFLNVVEDIVRSVYRQGFRRLMILNGHGGNNPAELLLVELQNELPGLMVKWYSWWESAKVNQLAQKYTLNPEHASWMEAFSFTRVTALPEGEKAPFYPRGSLYSAEKQREIYGDGMFGGAYRADDTVMQEMFDICLEEILEMLKFQE
jgi:creatinine amidohydrolase